MNKLLRRLFGVFLVGLIGSAQAGPGGPDDLFVGCDDPGACSITLDEAGNISGSFNGFFGPYDVTFSHIASTVNPLWVDSTGNALQVVSYEVVGKGGIAPLRLLAGSLGLCEFGVAVDGSVCTGPTQDDKSDVLVFTPLQIDANGFGHSRIDFLSDHEAVFNFATDTNVLEAGPEDANGAFYRALGASAEKLDFHIISDAVPEPATLALVAVALVGLGLSRRKA